MEQGLPGTGMDEGSGERDIGLGGVHQAQFGVGDATLFREKRENASLTGGSEKYWERVASPLYCYASLWISTTINLTKYINKSIR